MMDDSKRTMIARVKGYVQGVGFRMFVQGVALRAGAKGYVRNLPDGTVQVVACGDHASLGTIAQALWRGPLGAHVTSVETDFQDGEAAGLPEPFEVRP